MNRSIRSIKNYCSLLLLLVIEPLIVKGHVEGQVEHGEHSTEHSTMMMDNDPVDAFHMGVGENPFWTKEQNFTLWIHILSMTISFGILIPVGIILGFSNKIKPKWYINIQILSIITSFMGFFFGVIFKSSKAEDIYPMNFHSKFGWITLITLVMQIILGFIRLIFNDKSAVGFISISNESSDSLNADVESSETLLDNSKEFGNFHSNKQNNNNNNNNNVFTSKPTINIFYNILSIILVIFIYSQFLLGFITLSDTCHGESFGNCLAHYVKGSVFIWFGVVAFMRFLGFFEKFGWEWNLSSLIDHKVSFSFLESFIVFLYGITNVFLEHKRDDPTWNHRDIQHTSLALMWLWAGIFGIMIENKYIRKILFSKSLSKSSNSISNPVPSIIFIVTSISISSHHQKTEFSLAIHREFGGFLFLAGIFRLFTIITLYYMDIGNGSNGGNSSNSNDNDTNDTNDTNNDDGKVTVYPPTELISSFCFISSGLTLMIANKSLLFLFDGIYNFDSNFILNLVISLSFFILSYTTALLLIYKYSLEKK